MEILDHWGLLGYIVACLQIFCASSAPRTYRAAIVEHQGQNGRNPSDIMHNNLKVYAQKIGLASKQGVDIIVFPEYGLTGWNFTTRQDIAPYLHTVPDPSEGPWNPCKGNTTSKKVTQVIRELSCLAANFSIVIVANLATKVSCNPSTEPRCPPDRHFQFNTNVAFNKEGTLIGRYHKYNLFAEPFMDPAPKPEYSIFDAGFARFGMFICFDIVYYEPAVHLVEKLGVNNFVFPTAWVDELPFNTAVQIQSAWAYGLGVNLIAANYFLPSEGAIGSGIYSSVRGALNYTYDTTTPGRLLIADVPVKPPRGPRQHNCNNGNYQRPQQGRRNPKTPPGFSNNDHLFYYESLSNFSHTYLSGKLGHVSTCHGKLCCYLKFYLPKRQSTDVYALLAFSGNIKHIGQYSWTEQVCAVVHCIDRNVSSCGRLPHTKPTARFRHLDLSGNFETPFLYPHLFTTGLRLVPTNQWHFNNHQHCSKARQRHSERVRSSSLKIYQRLRDPILSAAIYGRQYDRD